MQSDARFYTELIACVAAVFLLFGGVIWFAQAHHWQWGGGNGCCIIFTGGYGYGGGYGYHGGGGYSTGDDEPVEEPVEDPVSVGDDG